MLKKLGESRASIGHFSPSILRLGRIIGVVFAFLVASIVTYKLYIVPKWRPASTTIALPTDHHLDTCPKQLEWLNNLTITFPINYARRDILVAPNFNKTRESVTKIHEPLFPETQIIDLMTDAQVKLQHCVEPLLLEVPPTPKQPVDASHVIFGMATLLDRLELSIIDLQRWLAHTNARLFIIAMGPDETDPDPNQMAEMESKMRSLGLKVTIFKRLGEEDSMPERYFSLVKLMYENREQESKWMGVIDDDTFFPSMHSLVEMLDAHEPEERWYLGAMSEEWWAVVRYGMMAFGGAGIFLSMPLAAALDTHYDDCKERSGAGAGDMRIRECIIWHTDTKLTHIPGLHQIDMHGDRSGLYESGRLPLSLHHWKEGWWDEGGYGTWFPMAAMHLIADICGDCFLQRWQFEGDMVLSNGYSISTYPTGAWARLEKEDHLGRLENTWNEAGTVEGSNNPGWDHYLGPLRPMLKLEEEKVQYRFLDAVAENGGVRQFYIHLGLDGQFDTLLELFWLVKQDQDAPADQKDQGG
ncbi:hypothetical protein ACLMJK_008703 [Lecanora helva]